MQISEKDIIDWLLGLGATVGALFTALYWYIWKGDRERLKNLETSYTDLKALVANSVTKQEAEHLFDRAKESYHQEHGQILTEISSLRTDIIKAITPWRGEERRGK